MYQNLGPYKILLLIILMISAITLQGQTIIGSKHDFTSGNAWFTSVEICEVCHTPHNADNTLVDSPLWNHGLSTAIYTIYGSSTIDGTIEQPNTNSRLCLSCHDGTVALDKYGNNSGNSFIDGTAKIGTDLSDDHPVSVTWIHQTLNGGSSNYCDRCHDLHTTPSMVSALPFFNQKVECSSCHNPHNTSGLNYFLRLPLTNGELCLYCHEK